MRIPGAIASITLLPALMVGCRQSVSEVTVRTDDLIEDRQRVLAGGDGPQVDLQTDDYVVGNPLPSESPDLQNPPTFDPAAQDLEFRAVQEPDLEAEAVLERIRASEEMDSIAERLSLDAAIKWACRNAIEYTGAEESYLLAALGVVTAEHLFAPQFFNDTSVEAGQGLDPRYDSAFRAINDFGVRQNLPFGGEVTARFLAELTETIDDASLGDGVHSATFVLDGRIPLLKGSGLAARESLVQSRRNLVYASRSFESFRRDFLVSIITDYLDLVLRINAIANAKRSVELNRQVEQREGALVAAGREDPFQADLARQATLFALDDLARQQDRYRLALDRFKVRIGMDPERAIAIVPIELQLPIPDSTQDESVRRAFDYRLDLQTARDRLEDLRRRIDLAENGMLPDLDLIARVRTNDPQLTDGVNFDFSDALYAGGVKLSLPLDRINEAVAVREAQVRFAQGERVYQQTLDEAAVNVRQTLRDIDQAQFSLLLQERNVEIAQNRIASIDAAPDRANARDRTDAVSGLRDAEDARDEAKRNLQVAILNHLNAVGMLRVTPEGRLQPLPNMPVGEVTRVGDP
ncbi:MAG: TolC family protein [Phycisphaera sp.]|nr:TolC family protein [Phycisphaera sp.]